MRALRPWPLPARMRAAAARLVREPTGRSRGARAYRSRHVSRAARCLLACWRLAKTPASSPCLPAAAGVWVGPPGSARLGAGLRARRRRRASIARRSTGACPVCSGHAVQHRQLSGKVRRARAGRIGRDGALRVPCLRALDRVAGSGLARRAARRQAAPHPFNSVFSLASLAATACGGRRRPPRFASAAYAYDTRIGSPPASPAAGPRGATLVGSVLSRLCSAA